MEEDGKLFLMFSEDETVNLNKSKTCETPQQFLVWIINRYSQKALSLIYFKHLQNDLPANKETPGRRFKVVNTKRTSWWFQSVQLSQAQVTGQAVSHELMSALGLCALKQRSWLEDLGPVGRPSFPAATAAASRSSCSATCSATAGTAAQMSKTARHVSTAQADFSGHVKGAVGEMKSTKCYRGVIRKRSYPRFRQCFVIYANTCAPAPAVCFVKGGDAPLAFAHERRSPAGLMCNLPLFVVSSGDVCGKKTNPCGEDAVCNQTNANSICQCKPGFKRNQKTGQCEGNRVSCSFYALAFNTHWRP